MEIMEDVWPIKMHTYMLEQEMKFVLFMLHLKPRRHFVHFL